MENLYFIIGACFGLLYLLFCIVNIFWNITTLEAFTYGILFGDEKPSDVAFDLGGLAFLVSFLLMISYPVFIFSTIIWLLSKLKKKS